ncbi:MAG: hypothetical protein WAV13_02075 [Thermodesulfovibrionales bacterium]
MHIAAIHNLGQNKEALAETLAAALGATVYEALSRLRSPGTGPFVVGVFAAIEPAEELVKRLRAGGFEAALLKEDEIETEAAGFIVRKFRFSSEALTVESGQGESLAVDYSSIDLIIRGTSIEQSTVTETVKEKKFDPGMALLTSGFKMTKTTEKNLESTLQTREGFFYLYAGDQQTLIFREGRLTYDALGIAMQPTRQANFVYLLEDLRRHSPEAIYDDRLMNRAGQVQLLGPSLSPEKHLNIATSLLAKVLR